MMHPQLSGRPAAAQRFLAEARAASLLRHPGSVTVFDLGQSEAGEMFLVMEYVNGPTLSELIYNEELPPVAAIDLVLEILGVLGEAHDAGVLNLDLHPDKVLVPQDRQGARHAKIAPACVASERLGGGHEADIEAVGRSSASCSRGDSHRVRRRTRQGGPTPPPQCPRRLLISSRARAPPRNAPGAPEHLPRSSSAFARRSTARLRRRETKLLERRSGRPSSGASTSSRWRSTTC